MSVQLDSIARHTLAHIYFFVTKTEQGFVLANRFRELRASVLTNFEKQRHSVFGSLVYLGDEPRKLQSFRSVRFHQRMASCSRGSHLPVASQRSFHPAQKQNHVPRT